MKLKYNSPVVLTFAIISGLTLILNFLTKGLTNQLIFCTYRSSIANPLTYVRLFTHVLGHASLSHYFGNMMLFLLLGPGIEEKYGSAKTAMIIAVTAIITGIINMFTGTALLGASGVVFAFIILSSMTSFKKGEIPLTLIIVTVMYIGQEIVNGITSNDNISQLAHIGGGLSGAVCGFFNKHKE